MGAVTQRPWPPAPPPGPVPSPCAEPRSGPPLEPRRFGPEALTRAQVASFLRDIPRSGQCRPHSEESCCVRAGTSSAKRARTRLPGRALWAYRRTPPGIRSSSRLSVSTRSTALNDGPGNRHGRHLFHLGGQGHFPIQRKRVWTRSSFCRCMSRDAAAQPERPAAGRPP